MYNVKGPSKIVAKTTRRGISQNMDKREYSRNKSMENDDAKLINGPRPVFHKKLTPNHHRQEIISPQHGEIIKYINDSWNTACSEAHRESDNPKSPSSIYYKDEPRLTLHNFKPFDLESWWGKRLYAYITGSSNGKTN